MKRSLFILPEAENEMAEAFDWYEARVHGLGSDFLLCLDTVFQHDHHWQWAGVSMVPERSEAPAKAKDWR